LLNYYRDGNDTVGWYADDEPEIGPSPFIASLSVGAEQDFALRENLTFRAFAFHHSRP
jgi:alkylated DNA repair dioxygenase AlkB